MLPLDTPIVHSQPYFDVEIMAREKPNQKRKRGGPASLPAVVGDASERASRTRSTDNEAEISADGASVEDADVAPHQTRDNSGKRGRPKSGDQKAADEELQTGTGAVRRSKRDRRSTDDNPWWIANSVVADDEEEEAAATAARAGKRPRLSDASTLTASKRQRGRPSLIAKLPSSAVEVDHGSKSKHPAKKVVEAESEPKHRGRPRKSDGSVARIEQPPGELDARSKRRGRPRISNVSAVGQSPTSARSKPTKRRSSGNTRSQQGDGSVTEQDDDLPARIPLVPKYRHIEERTRHIPRSIITNKWSSMDDDAIEAISAIMSNVSRVVLHRLQDRELRHQQAQKILRIFTGRLRSKLRKGMPFPPPSARPMGTKTDAGGGHVEELNYESIMVSIKSLEATLNPILHSMALLETEKAKEEAALEKEYEMLRTLEANARAEAGGWRERLKKAHPLAPDRRRRGTVLGDDRADVERLELVKPDKTSLAGVFRDTEDEGLQQLSKQIASHMLSIEKNVQPIQEVLPALVKSRAALQGVLQTHLASQQFERVLLG